MSAEVAPERLRVPELLHEQSEVANAAPLLSPTQAGTQPEFGEIYFDLLATIQDLLPCTGAAVLLPSGTAVVVLAQFGPHTLPDHIELSATAQHLLARMAEARQPVLVQRAVPFQPPLPNPAAEFAWLGIPVFLDDQLHSYLSLAGRFGVGDERTAFALAQQAAVGLRWFQRYAAAQRQMRQEQLLLDLARQVRQTRGQVDAFDQILEAAMACSGS